MNFPGLDPLWSGLHHAGHGLGAIRTRSLEQARAGLAANEKVLVVASTALGDSLLATPLLETLARRLGPARVSFLVKEPYRELYTGDPRLHRVFSVDGKYRWRGLVGELRADPHRLALLANLTEPDLVPALRHGGVRGFLRYRSRWTRYPRWMANGAMLRPPGAHDYACGHAVENNLAMAQALGFEGVTHRLALPHLAAPNASRERLVLIHPGASREIKRWPIDRWAGLATALVERTGVAVALTGAAQEKSLAAAIASRAKVPVENLAGALSLRDLAARQARAAAFLSGDTGPYHLAVALGCPTLTLFAPTDRGSSREACGPHEADPLWHRALQTQAFGEAISTLTLDCVQAEALDLTAKSLNRGAA